MMKRTDRLRATWLVGRKTRIRPLEAVDVPLLKRFRLAIEPQATGYIIQTMRGRDIGAMTLLVNGPQAAIALAVADRTRFTDGSAADALRVMTVGAMRYLPLERIEALVLASRRAVVHAFQRAGFKQEGTLREVVRRRGVYRDAVMLSRLRIA